MSVLRVVVALKLSYYFVDNYPIQTWRVEVKTRPWNLDGKYNLPDGFFPRNDLTSYFWWTSGYSLSVLVISIVQNEFYQEKTLERTNVGKQIGN